MNPPRFEIVQSGGEQPWHARYIAGNGHTLWATAQHKSVRATLNVIENLVEALGAGQLEQDWTYEDGTTGFAIVYRPDPREKRYLLRAEVRLVDERTAVRSA